MSHRETVERPRPGIGQPNRAARYSSSSAVVQSTTRALPGSSAPASQSTPVAQNVISMRSLSRRYCCLCSTSTRIAGRLTWATTYAAANIRPLWLNARGIATPITIAEINAVITMTCNHRWCGS